MVRGLVFLLLLCALPSSLSPFGGPHPPPFTEPGRNWEQDLGAAGKKRGEEGAQRERSSHLGTPQLVVSLEISYTTEKQTKTLPTNRGRTSLTNQELGELSEQFLNNLDEQIDRTLSLATIAKTHSGEDGADQLPGHLQSAPQMHKMLAAIRASQDIIARALCLSNKMELQLNLFQSLAMHLR
ncbi:hypothetical protein NDU88_003255 [Pleurodeles waltl]|uniref:Uncharacterized protein n=1 Tax=Pleurodeles waltl TaxID=8319 RepID=A0AAV7VHC9_PLEWA|nr:hypothetical protein NDU88_003255 [Pleurodeles waltl]